MKWKDNDDVLVGAIRASLKKLLNRKNDLTPNTRAKIDEFRYLIDKILVEQEKTTIETDDLDQMNFNHLYDASV